MDIMGFRIEETRHLCILTCHDLVRLLIFVCARTSFRLTSINKVHNELTSILLSVDTLKTLTSLLSTSI